MQKTQFQKDHELFIDKMLATHGKKLEISLKTINGINYIDVAVPYYYTDKKQMSVENFAKILKEKLNGEHKNVVIYFNPYRNAIMMKSWIVNIFKMKPSKEEYAIVYQALFSKMKINEYFELFANLFNNLKNVKMYVYESLMNYESQKKNIIEKEMLFSTWEEKELSVIKDTLRYIKKAQFSNSELEKILPILLQDYTEILKQEEKKYDVKRLVSSIEDILFQLIRNNFGEDGLKIFSEYLIQNNTDQNKPIILNKDIKHTFIELDTAVINAKYPFVSIDKERKEMFDELLKTLIKNKKLLNIESCNLVDTLAPEDNNILLISTKEIEQAEIVKDVFLKLLDFYGKNKKPDIDLKLQEIGESIISSILLQDKLTNSLSEKTETRNRAKI